MASAVPDFLAAYLPYVLRRADQTLSAPFYATLNEYGIARSEWRVLAVLEQLGPIGVVELAGAALSPQPTVTHALRRLEQRGLISRTPGTADRRQRVVSISSAGSELTRTLIAEATRLEAHALADVDDMTDLVQQLHELTTAIETRLAAHPYRSPQAG